MKQRQQKQEIRERKAVLRTLNASVAPEAADTCTSCSICELGGQLILCDICSQAFHYKCVNETKTNVASDYWWCCPECCVMNLNANLLRAQQVVVRTGDAKTKYVAYGETLFMQKYDETEEGAAEGGDTPVSYTHLTLPTTPYV